MPALWGAAEAATAVGTAAVLTWLGTTIDVNPLERIGQVSALAGIQLRMILMLGVTVALFVIVARHRPGPAVRLAAAAVAGLATGVTAAGTVVSLRGTVWPLFAQLGDAGVLQGWAYRVIDGAELPPEYPPGFPRLLALTAQVFTDGDVPHAMKLLTIAFVALMGPAAYLAWRMLLPPLWALGVGVTSMLPLIEPYKPYGELVLVVVIPVIAKLVQLVQRSDELSRRRVALSGAGLGVLLAAMILLYSGWFVWSSIGVVALVGGVLFRLRRVCGTPALLTGLIGVGSAAGAFLALAGNYLVHLLAASGTKDTYFYFDTLSDPAYFVMWGLSVPGPQKTVGWPPLGELGGVGVFAILLVVGLGFALALGIRQAAVLTAAACTVSAFLLRYWYASHMARDQAVQLYPRTSLQIMYCMTVLSGLACMLAAERVLAWVRDRAEIDPGGFRIPRPRSVRPAAVGALCAMGLLFGMSGSATASTYMPQDPSKETLGQLSWMSHVSRQPNGECPRFAPEGKCEPYVPPVRIPAAR